MLRGSLAGRFVGQSRRPETSPGSRACRPELVLAYAIAGLSIILVSGLTTRVYHVPLTAQFGLFELLPVTYWLGLVLVAASVGLALWRASDGLVAITGALLLAILAGTPVLFEPTPRYWDSYMHFSEAQGLGVPGFSRTASSYAANWPGAFLTILTLAHAAGTSALEFLGWFPFLAGGLTFLAIFEFLRATFERRMARLASVPTALFAVWAQFHVSPQAMGFVLFLLILATVRRRETKWRLVSAVLFLGLVVSHPTSAILLLTILGTYAVLSLITRFHLSASRTEVRRNARSAQRIAITFATVWLSWLFFLAIGSSEVAQVAVLTRMHAILGIAEQTLNLATQRTQENVLTWAPLIRTASLGVYGLVGLVSLVALFRDRGSRDRVRFLVAALVAPVLVGLADILAFRGQFYDRSILLFATIVPALCLTGLHGIRLPKVARTGLVVVLVAASVATASTAYYLEAFNLVPVEAIAASDFVFGFPSGSIVVDGMVPAPVWLDPATRPAITRLTFPQIYPGALEALPPGDSVYVVYDPTAELWYRQWRGSDAYEFYAAAKANYSLIYDNGWTEVYAVRG